MACAAGLAAIEVIEAEGLLDHALDMGEHARKRMQDMATRFQLLIGDIRGLGLLMGMELLLDKHTGERAIQEAEAVMYACLNRGLNFKVTMGNILTLTPSPSHPEEMDHAMDILESFIAEVSQAM